MTNPESLSDQALARFLDTEAQRTDEEQASRARRALIHTQLRDAIDILEIPTVVGGDPAQYKKDFNSLLDILRSEQPVDQPGEDEAMQEHMIRMIAAGIWDREHDLLIGFSLALEEQLFPESPTADKTHIKKSFMAKLIANENNVEQWLELADYLLEGEALDTARPEDMAIVLRELEQVVNRDATPEAALYDSIAAIFGLTDTEDEKLSPEERIRDDVLTLATRDITEAACLMAGKEMQPDRHEWIHGILRRYNITDQASIDAMFTLVDSFESSE